MRATFTETLKERDMCSDPNKNKSDDDIREDEITAVKDAILEAIAAIYLSHGIHMSIYAEDMHSHEIFEKLEERGPIL